jgi:O-antigen ligase
MAGTPERRALRVLQAGAIAVILTVVTWKQFELDRFFVPKELVLHASALLAGWLAWRAQRRIAFTWVDLLLALYLVLSIASGVFATNHWLALRAVTLTASSLAVYWAARAIRDAGDARPLLGTLAFAVVLGTITSLLQTYGVEMELFSINRAPGGTLGNRNFIAHMAAFGAPIVLLSALAARRFLGFIIGALGATLVVAALILTRSRAGWLAFAAVLLVFFLAMFVAPQLRRHGRTWRRLALLALLGAGGITAAVLTPNTLEWRGDTPYLDSMRGVANYQGGSGAGRLVQYRQSLEMALEDPLLGVGPGNWAVAYPEHAAGGDPSMSGSNAGMTSNPWPSSDWVAFVSERGLAAAALLALAFMAMATRGLQCLLNARDSDDALRATALLATLLAVAVAGLFDAVLMLGLPALLVWAALGALDVTDATRMKLLPASFARFALAGVVLFAAVGTVRSASQLAGMWIHAARSDVRWLAAGARIDPGNYDLRARLARSGSGLGRNARCRHARAAHALYPSAREAARLSRSCE